MVLLKLHTDISAATQAQQEIRDDCKPQSGSLERPRQPGNGRRDGEWSPVECLDLHQSEADFCQLLLPIRRGVPGKITGMAMNPKDEGYDVDDVATLFGNAVEVAQH